MSDDERALLQAVLDSPQDDLPRLVYADWLDENGRSERSTFIKVQLALAGMDKSCNCRQYQFGSRSDTNPTPYCRGRRCKLLRLQMRLRGWHWYSWSNEVLGESRVIQHMSGVNITDWLNQTRAEFTPLFWAYARSCVTFHRGFVNHVRLPLAAFERHAGQLFRDAPIEQVTITDREPFHGASLAWDLGWIWAHDEETFVTPESCTLPFSIYDELPVQNEYPTESIAIRDLSTACVTVGRRRAAKLGFREPSSKGKL